MPDTEGRDWIDLFVSETNRLNSPERFRLWSAIATVSGVLERKTWSDLSGGEIYANLYLMLVGGSASGKTQSIKRAKELWMSIEEMSVAPDNVTKAALIRVLMQSQRVEEIEGVMLPFSSLSIPAQEFSVFCPEYSVEFNGVMTSLFDGPDTHVDQRESDKGEKRVVTRPNLVVLGGTTPNSLNTYMPEVAWQDGFASRFIMVYSAPSKKKSLFSNDKFMWSERIVKKLRRIFDLKGAFTWDKEACIYLDEWHFKDCFPQPTHSKLEFYNGRRSIFTVKLSMIAAVSRSGNLRVTVEDVERAKTWLLNAELTMPDIFNAMTQKTDEDVIKELHLYIWRLWTSSAKANRAPVAEPEAYKYLQTRVTSEKIKPILELAVNCGVLRKGPNANGWIPCDISTSSIANV